MTVIPCGARSAQRKCRPKPVSRASAVPGRACNRADEPAVFSAAQVEAFAAEVARKSAGLPGADPAALAAGARVYAARQVSWPVQSLEQLRAIFEGAGLRIEQLSSAPMASAQGTLNLPTIAGGADYAHVVAVRP
jgi:hypothetical protein